MPQAPDWRHVEDTLFEHGKAAIEQFSQEHPDELCSFFAYHSTPLAGQFAVCLDTYFNGIQQAMEYELENVGRRQRDLKHKEAWRGVSHYTEARHILEYTYDVALFQYVEYSEVEFEGWSDFFYDKGVYPQSGPYEEDYLQGNVRIVLWRVLERLIKAKIFQQLHMSTPFRVGYQVEDHWPIVLRLLNWPTVEGTPIYSVLESPLVHKNKRAAE